MILFVCLFVFVLLFFNFKLWKSGKNFFFYILFFFFSKEFLFLMLLLLLLWGRSYAVNFCVHVDVVISYSHKNFFFLKFWSFEFCLEFFSLIFFSALNKKPKKFIKICEPKNKKFCSVYCIFLFQLFSVFFLFNNFKINI